MVAWTYHHLEEPTSVDLRTGGLLALVSPPPSRRPSRRLGAHQQVHHAVRITFDGGRRQPIYYETMIAGNINQHIE